MCKLARFGSVALLAGLAGCVLPPPPPPPLVALPGPGKTEVQFQADDGTCRAAADAGPPAATVPVQAPVAATAPSQAAPTDAAAPQTFQLTPGMVYLRCMTAHNNVVQPLAPARPLYYGFYPAYPVYYGFGDTYPWLYGDSVGFGFYGGLGWRGDHWGGGGGRWGGGGGWRR